MFNKLKKSIQKKMGKYDPSVSYRVILVNEDCQIPLGEVVVDLEKFTFSMLKDHIKSELLKTVNFQNRDLVMYMCTNRFLPNLIPIKEGSVYDYHPMFDVKGKRINYTLDEVITRTIYIDPEKHLEEYDFFHTLKKIKIQILEKINPTPEEKYISDMNEQWQTYCLNVRKGDVLAQKPFNNDNVTHCLEKSWFDALTRLMDYKCNISDENRHLYLKMKFPMPDSVEETTTMADKTNVTVDTGEEPVTVVVETENPAVEVN